MKRLLLSVFIGLMMVSGPSVGAVEEPVEGFRDTDLPLPRYVSLKADKVYVRTGPALRYPLKWVYKRKHMPVEIIQEYDSWRKVRDFEGDEGWIHTSLLTGERTVIVVSEDLVNMREAPGELARMVAKLEPMVIANPEECAMDWCMIEVDGYKGWVKRNFIWGIYADEELN